MMTDGFLEKLKKDFNEGEYQLALRQDHAFLESRLAVLTETEHEINNAKTITQLFKNTENYFKKLQEKYDSISSTRKQLNTERLTNASTVATYSRNLKIRLLNKYKRKVATTSTRLKAVEEKLEKLSKEYKSIDLFSPKQIVEKLAHEHTELSTELQMLLNELEVYKRYINQLENMVSYVAPPPLDIVPPPLEPTSENELELSIKDWTALVQELLTDENMPEAEKVLHQIQSTGKFSLKSFTFLSPSDSARLVTAFQRVLKAQGNIIEEIEHEAFLAGALANNEETALNNDEDLFKAIS